MPTLEEMTIWTAGEIVQEIERVLPRGWTLRSSTKQGRFWVQILQPEVEGQERVVVWEDYHIDQRILLFDALGWLACLGQKKQRRTGSLSRRRQLAEQAAARWAGMPREKIPGDPEDVDPEEVGAVYEAFRKK